MSLTLKDLSKQQELINKIQHDIEVMRNESKQIQAYMELEQNLAAELITFGMNTITVANDQDITLWQPDKFTKGKKDIIRDGTNVLLRSKRTTRTINPATFISLYPFEANILIEQGKIRIPIGVVEAEIGKRKTDDICEANVSYSYAFESRAYEPLAKTPEEPKDEPKPEKKPTRAPRKTKNKIKVDA